MRILIYGAGVIGSLYGALLAEAGFDVSVLARGKRLEGLSRDGLRYRYKGKILTAPVTVLSELTPDDRYDFIFLIVRENQLHTALKELRANGSPRIVTMVNSLETCDQWGTVCGKGRIIPTFPGAGGGFDGNVLDAALTPRLIQPTTLGKTDGTEKALARVFRKAKIPYAVVADMHAWQLCHLAMVVPLADAYYAAADPGNAGKDAALMRKTAKQIRENFSVIKQDTYVTTMTFPLEYGVKTLNLYLYINSQVMGVQFCDGKGSAGSNEPGKATPYKATLTINSDIPTQSFETEGSSNGGGFFAAIKRFFDSILNFFRSLFGAK